MSGIYSGFRRRVVAFVIDGIVLGVAITMVRLLFGAAANDPRLSLLQIVGSWLYFALQESSSKQATLGKGALGIKVTDISGNRIGFGQATGRYVAKLVSTLTLGVGYLMVVFTQRRQGLHDMIAGTLVVSDSLDPEEIATADVAPHVGGMAIAGVIVVGVLFNPFTVGVVAAIAIPAYQNYTIRAQIAEGLSVAESYKASVAAAITSGQSPQTLTSARLDLPQHPTARYVSMIRVQSATVSIVFGGTSNSGIQGAQLSLRPAYDGQGNVVWVCGRASPPPGTRLVVRDAQPGTSVRPQFLPQSCRE